MSRLPDNSSLPNDAEGDLRARFAEQRRGDHADAPVWRDEWLRAGTPEAARAQRRAATGMRLRWMIPAALGMACVGLALAAMLWLPSAFKTEPRLSEALPPLFDEGAGELFADLGSPKFSVLESPSDFLLPAGLQSPSHLNFINLP